MIKKSFTLTLCRWILIISATFLLTGCPRGEMSGLDPFPVERYLEAPLNLQGNVFLLEAQIDGQLAWEEGVGKLLAVRASDNPNRLAIFLPNSINQNMLNNQRYKMKVTIGKGGLIRVQAVEKY